MAKLKRGAPAAKTVIINDADEYLLLTRDNHPTFGYDPDLPGGAVDPGETPLEGATREVLEEVGFEVSADELEHLYTGDEYSYHHTIYHLYKLVVEGRPEVSLSWEHSEYKWVSREEFLEAAKSANDTYMNMVYAVLTR